MSIQGMSDSARSSAQMRLPLWGNLALSDPVFLTLVPLALVALFWGARRLGVARIGHGASLAWGRANQR